MLTVRVGRLRLRRGVSAIQGFWVLGVESLVDCARDANFLVGLTCGESGNLGWTYAAGKRGGSLDV